MDNLEAFARNQRFSGKTSAILVECPDGNLALFGWGGSGPLLYLGPSGDALLTAFTSRPAYEFKHASLPRPSKPAVVAGINLADIDIDL